MDTAHKLTSSPLPRFHRVPMGQFFTPLPWAEALIAPDLYQLWMAGARVFDPTGGQGHLLEAFVAQAVKNGQPVSADMLDRLCMTEIDPQCIHAFRARMQSRYGITVPAGSAIEADFLFQGTGHDDLQSTSNPGRFDVIVGNPPWINFADIPDDPSGYRDALKPLFLRYGLLENARSALWGGSRVDLAALVLVKALVDHLTPPVPPRGGPGQKWDRSVPPRGGPGDMRDKRPEIRAGFFLPLSLFRNEGAHNTFRRLLESEEFPLAVEHVEDITARNAFEGVRTRYAMVHFSTRESDGKRDRAPAARYRQPPAANDSHVPGKREHSFAGEWFTPPTVPSSAKPRQGVNTCGANAVFMFGSDDTPDLEPELLFPLIDRGCFTVDASENSSGVAAVVAPSRDAADAPPPGAADARPQGAAVYALRDAADPRGREAASRGPAGAGGRPRWGGTSTSTCASRFVLLPYNRLTGRVLDGETLATRYPKTWSYLCAHRQRLTSRRGSVIRSSISRGLWWALLGVGPYTFAPYKIVWPAYGAHTFTPRLFAGPWIPNQALQCSMSFSDPQDAVRVFEYLCSGFVERALLEAGGAGTPGWAQPGRMRGFFDIREDE